MKLNKQLVAVCLVVLTSACTYDFPDSAYPDYNSGDAQFTKMISVGSAYTAGLMNGALYTNGQDNSFVATLGAQMAIAGGGTFNQATANSPNGCYNPSGGCSAGRLYLKGSLTSAAPTPKAGDGGASLAAFANKANLNNFGVPGASLAGALSPALSANPYYNRIASSGGTSTLIGDAAAELDENGTFFTFWLGMDDVLNYATAGGTGSVPIDDITFNTYYTTAIGAMMDGNDANGVIANIPDVTKLPYFTMVAWNVLKLTQAQADNLNAAYAGYNGGVAGAPITAAEKTKRTMNFVAGNNGLVIQDETLTDLSGGGLPSYRQTTSADLVCLSAGAVIPTGGGSSSALADQYILLPSEISEIQGYVTAYNTKISAAYAGSSARLAFVDAYSIFGALRAADLAKASITLNGSAVQSSFTPPFGIFSVDGLHPNARGSAYLANKFIESINGKFGSTIPLCNPNDFAGNEFPIP